MAERLSLGFLGAGKMATALARGIIRAGLVTEKQVLAADPSSAARTAFKKTTGASATTSNLDVMEFASVLILAVKPDYAGSVLNEVRDTFTRDHLLISIVAGLPLAKMEGALGAEARLVRVMPNTPALLGCSATGYALSKAARTEDDRLAQKLFSAVGVAFPLKESLLDAVTGLSGSGPAYVYLFIEALSDGGVASGLPRDVATQLAAQTVLGGARMVLETGLHPGALKDMVTSPGGTTIEGLHELEKAKFRGGVISAVRAATEKSKKLGH
jgi:pyrroline-5-carboxylate reductase